MNNHDKYYKALLRGLEDFISAEYDCSTADEIYSLTQTFLSELVNCGYSIEFLYNTVVEYFFSDKTITDALQTFNSFVNVFTFEAKEYAVYFPIPSWIKTDLNDCFNLKIEENIFEMFNNQYPYIGKLMTSELDPELARSNIIKIVEMFLSIIQYSNHNDKAFNIYDSDVVDINTGKCYYLKEPISAILRGKRERERVISKKFCPHHIKNLLNAISLHSSAIRSKDINNQFLSLWTAIEVLIPVERKGSFSRINQISNIISTVMTITYFRSLLYQLNNDLSVIKDVYESCISDISGDPVYSLACILSKPEHAHKVTQLTNALDSYPILKHRISKYEKLLKSPEQSKLYYENHSQRISQQIMRIYRTRNMIVHDGTHSVYIELIIQNLHYYLDTLIDIVYATQRQGFESIDSIFKNICEIEKKFLLMFETDTFSDESIKFLCSINDTY